MQLKRHDEAIDVLQSLVDEFPDVAEWRNRLAHVYRDRGFAFREASDFDKYLTHLADLVKVIELEPDKFIDRLPSKALSGDPGGRHEVWNASLCGAPAVAVGDFIPQIWLGNEHRGLLWYADSDSWVQLAP